MGITKFVRKYVRWSGEITSTKIEVSLETFYEKIYKVFDDAARHCMYDAVILDEDYRVLGRWFFEETCWCCGTAKMSESIPQARWLIVWGDPDTEVVQEGNLFISQPTDSTPVTVCKLIRD